ncbi:putative transcription factor bHLH family [Helianthus annuus]|nr:putative transcription factor bHLH family [Helianthus annuus]KAJ0499476.1 putative transcription factor bHLH family [Helianthus annuus]KAJ0672934.1 putative transcription factor bHLH family [Helianthus annuus]
MRSVKVGGVQGDGSVASLAPPEAEGVEKECSRKRGHSNSCSKAENKACRERQRREILNNRFLELSSTLEPDRPAPTDKLAILGDAIRVLNQLKSETQDFKETNEKLWKKLKQKNELREEKLVLKAEKAKMEQQVKSMTNNIPPPGFMAPHPAAFQAGAPKMPVFPGYGYIPVWQYLPPSTCDTSHDHELRPPAA